VIPFPLKLTIGLLLFPAPFRHHHLCFPPSLSLVFFSFENSLSFSSILSVRLPVSRMCRPFHITRLLADRSLSPRFSPLCSQCDQIFSSQGIYCAKIPILSFLFISFPPLPFLILLLSPFPTKLILLPVRYYPF